MTRYETIFDREIWVAAIAMLVRYGSAAAIEAGNRSDKAAEREDFSTSAVWQRIMAALLLLLADKPRKQQAVN